MRLSIKYIGLLIACLLALAQDVAAQSYLQTSRALVQAPEVLGRGNATVALPSATTVFFYNPAHLGTLQLDRPRITFGGVRGSLANSGNLLDQIAFAKSDLMEFVELGVDAYPAEDLRAFYDEARRLTSTRTIGVGDVLLPTYMTRVDRYRLGGGLFWHNQINYRVNTGGGGTPDLDLTAHSDLIFVTTGATSFGDLSVGVTPKFTHRRVTFKDAPFDAIENFYIFSGNALTVDAGLLYPVEVPRIGRVNLGAAVYDLPISSFNYSYAENLTTVNPSDERRIAKDEQLVNEQHGLHPSFRAGVAYTRPRLGPFTDAGLALDYMTYAQPDVNQVTLARLHLGLQARWNDWLMLRTGINQGYFTIGTGIHLDYFQLEYAYYGVEEGRLPGQLSNWFHSVEMTFGLFRR